MDFAIFLLGIASALVGIGLIFGFNWALIIFDWLSIFGGDPPTGSYVHGSKEEYKGTEKRNLLYLGIILLILGAIGATYGFMQIS